MTLRRDVPVFRVLTMSGCAFCHTSGDDVVLAVNVENLARDAPGGVIGEEGGRAQGFVH
jgi:hypothetical protein